MAKLSTLMAKLQKLDGAIVNSHDPHSRVLATPSPSMNFIYGNGWGLPLGFTQILYGPPRGGKSVLANAMIGQLHKDYEDGVVIKFDTEFREMGQMLPQTAGIWGIDRDRYICYSVNSPDLIFDRIEKEIAAMCQDGLPLKLVIIDSISGIQGRRAMNAESVMNQQIGDQALTLQTGFQRILPVQRKYGFSVILTAHVRAEFDIHEQNRGNKYRMNASFGVKHYAEYYTYVEPLLTKAGRTSLMGEAFEDDTMKDLAGKSERTGHKVRVIMKDSSLGPKGRTGIFTLDYNKGIINTHEEIVELGKARGVIETAGSWHNFGDKKWQGEKALAEHLRTDTDLAQKILQEIKTRDVAGLYAAQDAVLAASLEV